MTDTLTECHHTNMSDAENELWRFFTSPEHEHSAKKNRYWRWMWCDAMLYVVPCVLYPTWSLNIVLCTNIFVDRSYSAVFIWAVWRLITIHYYCFPSRSCAKHLSMNELSIIWFYEWNQLLCEFNMLEGWYVEVYCRFYCTYNC